MEKQEKSLQQLLVLALLQKQNEIKQVKALLEEVFYLMYLSEIMKFHNLEEPLNYTDPTGMWSSWGGWGFTGWTNYGGGSYSGYSGYSFSRSSYSSASSSYSSSRSSSLFSWGSSNASTNNTYFHTADSNGTLNNYNNKVLYGGNQSLRTSSNSFVKDSSQYNEQRNDISAPTNSYCVYDTEWNAYKAMYKLDKEIDLNDDQAKLARSNAIGNGVKENGFVYRPEDLASSFNNTFNTNYKYEYTIQSGNSIPNDLSPKFYSDGVDMPFVRYDHCGYAHTTNSLGNQTVHDVWHDRVEQLGGPIVNGVIGYDKSYESGGYRFGYHKFRL